MSVCVSVYKEVDLLLKSNNTDHHTAEISVDQLIVRRGQAFNVSLTLAQPFNGDLHPLTFTAKTGETFQTVFVDWRSALTCPVVSLLIWLLLFSVGHDLSEDQGTTSCFGIPDTVQRSPTAKAAWKSELLLSSTPLLGILKLTITPPADAPIGEYILSVTHREEEKSLAQLVLLFNPWCPGG